MTTAKKDQVLGYEEYADWLSDSSLQSYGVRTIPRETIFDMGNGMVVYAERLMFHWAMKTAVIGDQTGFDGRWCYEGGSPLRVLVALAEWKERGYEGKPTGWRREPKTGLRRNDNGDPESEKHESEGPWDR